MSLPTPRITWATICIFGDSITEGAGDESGWGWADQLKADWKRPRPEVSGFAASSGYPNVYNLGIDGDRTIDVLNRFDIEVAARLPRGIILSIGANDLQWADDRRPTGVKAFSEQYTRLTAAAAAVTPHILCLSLVRADETVSGHGIKNTEVDQFNKVIQGVALRHGAELLDVSQLLGPVDFCDGIHPNRQGHQKLYEAVKTKITALGWAKL